MSFLTDLINYVNDAFPGENVRVYPSQLLEKSNGVVIQEFNSEQALPSTNFIRRFFNIFLIKDENFDDIQETLIEFARRLAYDCKGLDDCFGCEGYEVEVELEDNLVIGKLNIKFITKGG